MQVERGWWQMKGRTVVAVLTVWLTPALTTSGQTTLPVGRAPAALEFRHFPDRVHAVIWRNWGLVDAARVARVLGTTVEHVKDTARAMGLPQEPKEPPPLSRVYLTVIRWNWHLLPYEQLLELLDWTPQRMAETLRGDDFFWHKLGELKPRCDPVRWAEPDEPTRAREAEIRRIVQAEFGTELAKPAEPRLAFLESLSGKVVEPRPVVGGKGVRFLYSYFAVFGDPLLDPSLDPYPDALLQKYADLGVNGVWLHVVLRDLAPSKQFPEFGQGAERRLANLKALVARAKRFGISVYLYMNEPRAMLAAFFKGREEMAGVHEGEYVAMCTSSPAVRQWLTDSLAHVFGEVPDLGGVFTITASENLTNCASHHHREGCPRCKDRPAAEILAELNAAIESGVHRGSPSARVIVWDWGWKDADAADVIARLPRQAEFMSVSEWSLPLERGGVKSTVGEYSLSAVGPGPRATRHWALAAERGLPRVAKVQINNTWELSAVPYLPVMDLVAEHCHRLAEAGVDGMMLSWSLGGYPSPNLEVAHRFERRPTPSVDEVLDAVAAERYGAGAADARRAWGAFSKAFIEYPYNSSVIYLCPVQMGPANLLWARPTGYAATMVGLPYDDLKRWCGPYPPEVFAAQFEKVAAGWEKGLDALAAAVAKAPAERRSEAAGDLRLARAAGLHLRSVANQARFVMARDALAKAGANREELRATLRQILADEERLAKEMFALTREDSRIGFEASNHYYYLPQDLIEKLLNCRGVERELGDPAR
jgi:hypothetical protein